MITNTFNTIFPESFYTQDSIDHRTLKLAFFLGASAVVSEINKTNNCSIFDENEDIASLLDELHEYFKDNKFIEE